MLGTENISQLSRRICAESGVELDQEGLDKVREVVNRVGGRWPMGARDILQERNKPLLEKLTALENHLDSLLLLPHKQLVLKKEFQAKLEEYESVIGMCIEYSERHTNK